MCMTDKTLKSLINKLNKNKSNDLIFIRPLSSKVDFAKVWIKLTNSTNKSDIPTGPHNFYFIKNDEGKYIATVYDMEDLRDLHWFVLSQNRGQGHLTKALKEVIVFHLFQDRDTQRITIDENAIGTKNFEASENVALKIGFTRVSQNEKKTEYYLTKNKYKTNIYLDGENIMISETELNELNKKIEFLAYSLKLIQTEIEMKLGSTDFSDEFNDTINDVEELYRFKMEDAWWDSKKY
jgi:RimJ/RimL family protein N-acetyltransferase